MFFTFLIRRVPIPVCGSNTPPARAFLLKNHWKLVSFLRFVACLKSTFRSQGPKCMLFLNGWMSFYYETSLALEDCTRILETSFFIKISDQNMLSLNFHCSADKHLDEHCLHRSHKIHI